MNLYLELFDKVIVNEVPAAPVSNMSETVEELSEFLKSIKMFGMKLVEQNSPSLSKERFLIGERRRDLAEA